MALTNARPLGLRRGIADRHAGLRLLTALCLVFLVMAAVGCKKMEEAPPAPPPPQEAPAMEAAPAAPAPDEAAPAEARSEAAPSADSAASGLQKSKPAAAGRKIILSFVVSLEVKSATAAFNALDKVAEQSGAYVIQTAKDRREDGTLKGSVTFRVPPGSLGGFLARVRALGKIVKETSSGQDITDQYVDLEARIRNAKSTEEEVLKILHERSGRLSEILEVAREVARIRGEIEEMEARKRNFDLLTDTSSVTVEIAEPETPASLVVSSPFRPIWESIKSAFNEGMELMAGSVHFMVLAFLTILPWALVIILIYLVWLRHKRREERSAPPAIAPPAQPAASPLVRPTRIKRPPEPAADEEEDGPESK